MTKLYRLSLVIHCFQAHAAHGGGNNPKFIQQAEHIVLDMIEKRQKTLRDNKSEFAAHTAHEVAWVVQKLFTVSTLILLGFWCFHGQRKAFVCTFFVQSIASLCYYAKCSGIGYMEVYGVQVPFIRYLDWITTTPLMLYELCHIGHAPAYVTMMIIGCDIMTLSLGICSAVIGELVQ